MQPTIEQQDAIHIHDKNQIVVAGAGSGKTRVLVERYLQLLADHPRWPISSLVAITFTREAAFEMRHRLRQELERRAQKSGAAQWAKHLAELDSARIDTIHGLCADLLRANAAQAGIDPKFEVLDEVEAAFLLEDIVDDLLTTIEAPLTELFAHYDAWKIERALKQIDLVNKDLPPLPEEPETLLKLWEQQWSDLAQHARERLLDSEEVAALEALGDAPAGDKLSELIREYDKDLARIRLTDDAEEIRQIMDDCQRDGAVGNKGSAKNWGSKAAKHEAAILLRELRKRIQSALKEVGEPLGEVDRATAWILPLWHQLLRRAQDAYREQKVENAQLDFDDLERLTAELLRDRAVQDRYRGAEFNHLLVDEFQDTNQAQWQIIRALADLQAGGSLFVVGDPKQSIYQFRGADVSVFNTVRDQIADLTAGMELPLSTSFRSHRRLLEQFNALFSRLLVRDDDSPVKDFEVIFDKPMAAFRKDSPADPPIELMLLDREARDETGEYVKGNNSRRKRYPADDMRRWEAYEIAGRIKSMIGDNRQIFDKDSGEWRGIDYGDIAILFQSMTRVTIYEDVFKAEQIPYLTVAGRGYYDRQEVWDMVDLLRFLHNPADNLSLATVLRSPIFGFSDDLLFALRLITDERNGKLVTPPLLQALQVAADSDVAGVTEEDRPRLRYALDTLRDLRRISGRVTIAELLRSALTKTNYLAILTGLPDGARRRGNIEKLLHLAEDSGRITLGKFSRYLVDLTAREAREGEALLEAGNTVRLMTVHASKGLEFPLVILADAAWERGNYASPTLLVDPVHGLSCHLYDAGSNKYNDGFAHRRNFRLQTLKQAAERKRLLYVAATRAQDYLLISGPVTLNSKQEWSAGGWLGQLLSEFGLNDIAREEEQTRPFADDEIRVLMPPAPPSQALLLPTTSVADNLWDFNAEIKEFPPLQPPMIEAPPSNEKAQPSHITATQIAYIGAYLHSSGKPKKAAYRQHFRDSALRDMPARLQALEIDQTKISERLIGEIVHELLRYLSFDLETMRIDDMIRSIAWGRGLTNPAALRKAVNQVSALLSKYKASDIYQWIKSARLEQRPIYTELPFIFRAETRVIHGVMDVLLQDSDGCWTIIDYKTSRVADGEFERHSRRYRLQLGVYAAAAQAQLGLDRFPRTLIHYLRDNHTVTLPSDVCQEELKLLESTIGDLVASDA